MGALFTEDLVHVLGDGELMVASGKSLDQGTYGNRKLTACKFSRHLPRFSTERMGLVHLKNTSMPCGEHTWAVSNGDNPASYKHKSTRTE